MSNNNSETKLETAIKEIKKNYGEDSIMRLGDKPSSNIEVISSGSLLINEALGIGGYPKGRIIEIFGPESSGKTTLALHAIAETQKKGGKVAFIDAENSLDPIYAKKIGVNVDELFISQPSCGEEALGIVERLVLTGEISLIVIDSVAALVPKVEIDNPMEENQVGLLARLMSKAMRKLSGPINATKTIVIFINQLRENVGIIYGNRETTTGGRALKFYASIRMEIRKGEAIKNNNNEIIGNIAKIKIFKNKLASPYKTCNVEIIFGQGISIQNEILDMAIRKEFIKKYGSWYELDGEKIGQGKETAKEFLKSHPDIAEDLLKRSSTNNVNNINKNNKNINKIK